VDNYRYAISERRIDIRRDNYQDLLRQRPEPLGGQTHSAINDESIRDAQAEAAHLDAAVNDVLASIEDAKQFVLRQGKGGGERLAQELAALIHTEATEAAGLRVLDGPTLFNVGMPAVDKLRDYLVGLKGQLDSRLAPIRALVTSAREAQRNAELAREEAESLRLARGWVTATLLRTSRNWDSAFAPKVTRFRPRRGRSTGT